MNQPPDVLPPHDVSAEEAVIAALLLADDAIAHVLPIVEAADFFREEHKWAYEAAIALYNRNEAITVPTIAHELERAGRLDAIGGEGALIDIQGRHFTAIGVESHARIVARDARYRRMIQAAGQIARLAYEGGPDAARVLAAAMGLLGNLVEERDLGLVTLGDLPSRERAGIPWGIPALDRYTMGMPPGEITIAAGGVGSGKSMFAAQAVRNCAYAGGSAIVFTMEMSAEAYQARMAHAIASVRKPYSLLESPLTEVEQALVDQAKATIRGWNVQASERGGVTVPSIRAALTLANAQRHIDLVVIDYLQLMGMPGDGEVSAANLKRVTGELKRLAVDEQCHIIVVSQMNRASQTEMRSKQGMTYKCAITDEPFPAPFKEALMGGAVEGDADLVVMIQDHTQCRDGLGRSLNHIEVCITKNRNGVEGHGLLFRNYNMCRLDVLTEKDCFDIAGGDLGMARRLRIDAGLLRDDWRDREVAAAAAEGWEPAGDGGPTWARSALDEAFSRE